MVRDTPGFPAALVWWLDQRPDGTGIYLLAGGMGAPGDAIDPAAELPALPPGWSAEPVRSFSWSTRVLERTVDRAPRSLLEQRAQITLYRLQPPAPEAGP